MSKMQVKDMNDINSPIYLHTFLRYMDLRYQTVPLIQVTDKILPVVKEWQQRPLESIYAVVFMDAIHYHVRCEGRIVKKAVYVAIGINLDGRKEVLEMYELEQFATKWDLNTPKSAYHGEITGLNYQHISSIRNL